MGYSTERFVVTVKEGLLCCICQEVLEDPVQAATCEHAYCRQCIHAWLFQQHTCPECRTPLHSNQLRPLFRYMRNDLDQLQIQCGHNGCTEVCPLEHLAQHESRDCPHRPSESSTEAQRCPTCAQYVASEEELQRHLDTECAFRELGAGLGGGAWRRECPHGCGMELLSAEDAEHSCVAELRTAMELVRAELLCRLGEQREEMELRLNTQRRHMARRDQAVREHLQELRSHLLRLQHDIRELKEERKRDGKEDELVERLARLSRQCSMEPANM